MLIQQPLVWHLLQFPQISFEFWSFKSVMPYNFTNHTCGTKWLKIRDCVCYDITTCVKIHTVHATRISYMGIVFWEKQVGAKMLQEYERHTKHFEKTYYRHSNVESAFGSIKAQFGGMVRAKSFLQRQQQQQQLTLWVIVITDGIASEKTESMGCVASVSCEIKCKDCRNSCRLERMRFLMEQDWCEMLGKIFWKICEIV